MSVIGISPSDIVAGIRAIGKGVSALKEDGGAQSQYRQASDNLRARHAALVSLRDLASSNTLPSSAALARVLEDLQGAEEATQNQLKKYEKALGPQATPGGHHGVKRKLGWAFSREQKLNESDGRTRPGVDAAVLQALILQTDLEQSHHNKLEDLIQATNASILQKIEDSTDVVCNNFTSVATQLHSITKQRNKVENRPSLSFQEEVEALLLSPRFSQMIEQAISQLQPSPSITLGRRSMPGAFLISVPTKSRKCRKRVAVRRKELAAARNEFGSLQLESGACSTSQLATRMHALILPWTADPDTDTTKAAFLLLITTLYAVPSTKKVIWNMLNHLRNDPLLAALVVITGTYVLRCLLQIPKQLSLLSDTGILFEDAFGTQLRVPFIQCEHFEIFAGFLEYHFRSRPGLRRVLEKRYRLLLGDAKGSIVDSTNWRDEVKPRARLTMAMLLHSYRSVCAKRYEPLVSTSSDSCLCYKCDQWYSIASTASIGSPGFVEEIDEDIVVDNGNEYAGKFPGEPVLGPGHQSRCHDRGNESKFSGSPAEKVRQTEDLDKNPSVEEPAFLLKEPVQDTDAPQASAAPATVQSSKVSAPKSIRHPEVKLFKNITLSILKLPRGYSDTGLLPMITPKDVEQSRDWSSVTAEAGSITDDELMFPSYNNEYLGSLGDVEMLDSEKEESLRKTDRLQEPNERTLTTLDDSCLESTPSQHVDYLNHEWKEQDLWNSWKYVVRRRVSLSNSVRLENASWRAWIQQRNSLPRIPPERLNWLKDCDVTWLYGPLKAGQSVLGGRYEAPIRTCSPDCQSHGIVKPILKKKEHSVTMLERSISSKSLLKQACALLRVQQSSPAARSKNDVSTADFTSPLKRSGSSVINTSDDGSTDEYLHLEPKRVQFSEVVEQCISLDGSAATTASSSSSWASSEDEDQTSDRRPEPSLPQRLRGLNERIEHSWFDGNEKKWVIPPTSAEDEPKSEEAVEDGSPSYSEEDEGGCYGTGRTIAPLPDTTLKPRVDISQSDEVKQLHAGRGRWRLDKALSPSPSPETLQPSRPRHNFLIDEDDEDLVETVSLT